MTAFPPSWYAETAAPLPAFAALGEDTEAEVCVIGGGFSGVNVALELAGAGVDVVLLEAARIGWGASGRNGGQVIGDPVLSGHVPDEAQDALRWRGHEIIRARIARHGIEAHLAPGHLTAAFRPRQLRALEAGLGEGQEMVDAARAEALTGHRAYCGGLLSPRDFAVHPLNLVRGEARAAAEAGARIFEGTPALSVSRGLVSTARGRVRAKTVVIAGNAYHRLMPGRLGGYVFPAGSYLIATEPLAEPPMPPGAPAVADANVVLDYYRMTHDGRMLFGGRCNYSGRVPRNIAASMRPRMERLWPSLKDARITHAWGGNIAITISRNPMIAEVEPGIMVLQGYCGHGVNVTHIAAEAVALRILGDGTRFEMLRDAKQWRLPLPGPLGSWGLAAGMVWYRARDMV